MTALNLNREQGDLTDGMRRMRGSKIADEWIIEHRGKEDLGWGNFGWAIRWLRRRLWRWFSYW